MRQTVNRLAVEQGVGFGESALEGFDADQIRSADAVIIAGRSDLYEVDTPASEHHTEAFCHDHKPVSQPSAFAGLVKGDIQTTDQLLLVVPAKLARIFEKRGPASGLLFIRAENRPFNGAAPKFFGNGQARDFCDLFPLHLGRKRIDIEMPFNRQGPLRSENDASSADQILGVLEVGVKVDGMMVVLILLQTVRMVFGSFEAAFVDINLVPQPVDGIERRSQTVSAIDFSKIEKFKIHANHRR